MAKNGQLIGWKKCHDCGDAQCEVRLDKKGNPYAICFECDPPSQDFTLGRPARLARFVREGFRPQEGRELPAWAAPVTAPGAPKAEPAPKAETAKAPPVPAKKVTMMG